MIPTLMLRIFSGGAAAAPSAMARSSIVWFVFPLPPEPGGSGRIFPVFEKKNIRTVFSFPPGSLPF